MLKTHLRTTGVFVLIFNLVLAGLPQVSLAGLVGTGTAMEMQAGSDRTARIDAFLARDDVKEQMMQLGVTPAQAQARVAQLTDSELVELQNRIDELPAGGSILALIGAVFVVLMILELVGVINIFQKF
jgi:hypothetical protein